jgi:hypothetical protein
MKIGRNSMDITRHIMSLCGSFQMCESCDEILKVLDDYDADRFPNYQKMSASSLAIAAIEKVIFRCDRCFKIERLIRAYHNENFTPQHPKMSQSYACIDRIKDVMWE